MTEHPFVFFLSQAIDGLRYLRVFKGPAELWQHSQLVGCCQKGIWTGFGILVVFISNNDIKQVSNTSFRQCCTEKINKIEFTNIE